MAFDRRTMLKTAVGAATTLAATPGFAANCQVGPAPRDKGAKVWLDLDQIELDSAYDQSEYAPMIGQILKRYGSRSVEIRARLGEPKRFSYGPTPVEALDVFPARTSNAPIFVFVHGGAWRSGEAKDYAFPAELFVNAGVNFVVLDFIAVGAAQGDISVMAQQVRNAIAWTYKNAATLGGDPSRFFVGGHSSGRPSLWPGAGHRLAEGVRLACQFHQRRTVHERSLRHEAGTFVEAQLPHQVHR